MTFRDRSIAATRDWLTPIRLASSRSERPASSHATSFRSNPGSHHLQVSYQYLRLSLAGKASIQVDVAPKQVVQASYQAPKSVLVASLPGKLTVEQPVRS